MASKFKKGRDPTRDGTGIFPIFSGWAMSQSVTLRTSRMVPDPMLEYEKAT